MPRPPVGGWFGNRGGGGLIGGHYQDLVRRGQNPERLAEKRGQQIEQIEGGIRVVPTEQEEKTEEGDSA